MKWLCHLAARLYPVWWRQRYGWEFEALLEDLKPGVRDVLDVFHGALRMQTRTLGAIPVICTFAGAVIGGIIATQTPAVYASSATIVLKATDNGGYATSVHVEELRASLETALGESGGNREATSVTLLKGDSTHDAILRLTYLAGDPAQAQRVAEKLTAAIATDNRRPASTEVLQAAGFPRSPVKPDFPMGATSGGGVGLVLGGVAALLLRSRQRSANAG